MKKLSAAIHCIVGGVLISCVAPAQAVVYVVGSSGDCDGVSINSVIGSTRDLEQREDEIRVAIPHSHAVPTIFTGAVNGGLTIRAGYASCADARLNVLPAAVERLVLHPNATGDSVIDAKPGGQLLLENIVVADARRSDKDGGGVVLEEGSKLTLFNSAIEANHARKGGGVFAKAGAQLILRSNSYIADNRSVENGAGIYLDGATLDAGGQNISFFRNFAGGNGGAIFSNGGVCAIDTGGGFGFATFHANEADNGGAIALTGGAIVDLKAPSGNSAPIRFQANTARESGGAIFAGVSAGATYDIVSAGAVFDANSAVSGAAVFLQGGMGGGSMLTERCQNPTCNTYLFNKTPDATGSIVHKGQGVRLDLDYVSFVENGPTGSVVETGVGAAPLSSSALNINNTVFSRNSASSLVLAQTTPPGVRIVVAPIGSSSRGRKDSSRGSIWTGIQRSCGSAFAAA